jgi:hypothetical protein
MAAESVTCFRVTKPPQYHVRNLTFRPVRRMVSRLNLAVWINSVCPIQSDQFTSVQQIQPLRIPATFQCDSSHRCVLRRKHTPKRVGYERSIRTGTWIISLALGPNASSPPACRQPSLSQSSEIGKAGIPFSTLVGDYWSPRSSCGASLAFLPAFEHPCSSSAPRTSE